jgi:hypothetical protein
LRDLVYGQAKINESLQKKLAATDKSMETIHAKMDGFSTAIKNHLSFNKMIETQLAQVAADMPPAMENVKAITTRGGKTTQDRLILTMSTGRRQARWQKNHLGRRNLRRFMKGKRLRMNFMALKYCRSL